MGNLTGHVASGLGPLRNNHVNPGLLAANGLIHRANLMQHRDARRVRGRHEFRGISPEERQGRNPLVDAYLNAILVREMEDQVHPERSGCKAAKITDLLPQRRRRAELRLEDAEAAGIAHGSDELGSREIGSHGSDDDRGLNPKPLAETCS
jgi:hypothetical protein